MNVKNIPKEIQALNQWVCSKADSKAPQQATCPYPASSTNPNTWCSFERAVSALSDGTYEYLGFVFNDNGLIGIDIDDGYDTDGLMSVLASDIIGRCKSYTEKSKSGRGFHILLKGNLPFNGRNNRNGVEIYKTGRYFIMTGETMLYKDIIANQEAIDYIVKKYFPDVYRTESGSNLSKIYTPSWNEVMCGGKIKLRPTYPPIPDGCRNISLTSLAGALHSQGYTPEAIYEELCYCNKQACKPELPQDEVINIVKSVIKYRR